MIKLPESIYELTWKQMDIIIEGSGHTKEELVKIYEDGNMKFLEGVDNTFEWLYDYNNATIDIGNIEITENDIGKTVKEVWLFRYMKEQIFLLDKDTGLIVFIYI